MTPGFVMPSTRTPSTRWTGSGIMTDMTIVGEQLHPVVVTTKIAHNRHGLFRRGTPYSSVRDRDNMISKLFVNLSVKNLESSMAFPKVISFTQIRPQSECPTQ
jgi:hypothetical protein